MKRVTCKSCGAIIEFEDNAAAIECGQCHSTFRIKVAAAAAPATGAAPASQPAAAPDSVGAPHAPVAVAAQAAPPPKRPMSGTARVRARREADEVQPATATAVFALVAYISGGLLIAASFVLLLVGPLRKTESMRPALSARQAALSIEVASLRQAIVAEKESAGRLDQLISAEDAASQDLTYRSEMLEHRATAAASGGGKSEFEKERAFVEQQRSKMQSDLNKLTDVTDPVKVIARCQKAVIVVVTNEGSGSGFIITDDGMAVTNYHVVEGCTDLTVRIQARGAAEMTAIKGARVIAADIDRDLALLRLPDTPAEVAVDGHYPVAPMRVEPPQSGEAVIAIGNPGLGNEILDYTVTRGIISNAVRKLHGREMIQASAPVNPGNSGGPLFDSAGNVVGVIASKGVHVEAVTFAIPMKTLADLLQRKETDPFVVGASFQEWERKNNPFIELTAASPALSDPAIVKTRAPVARLAPAPDGKSVYALMSDAGIIEELKTDRTAGRSFNAGGVVLDFVVSPAGTIFLLRANPPRLVRLNMRTFAADGELALSQPATSLHMLPGAPDLVVVLSDDGQQPRFMQCVAANDAGMRGPPDTLPPLSTPLDCFCSAKWFCCMYRAADANTIELRAYPTAQAASAFQRAHAAGPQGQSLNQFAGFEHSFSIAIDGPDLLFAGGLDGASDSIIVGRRVFTLGDQLKLERVLAESSYAQDQNMSESRRALFTVFDNITAVSPGGAWASNATQIFELSTGKVVKKLPFLSNVQAYSRDGKMLYIMDFHRTKMLAVRIAESAAAAKR